MKTAGLVRAETLHGRCKEVPYTYASPKLGMTWMSMKSVACVLAMSVVLVACKKPADASATPEATAQTTAAAQAHEQPAAHEDTAEEGGSDTPQAMTERDGLNVAMAMLAAVEQCGLSTPAENAVALEKMAQEGAKKGLSTVGIQAQYQVVLAGIKAAALKDPAKAEASCTQLRAMRDPETIKKMEKAAAELEKLAKQMEAKPAG